MSTIPIQNLIIDNDTDIGLTSDLINGTFKSSSLTDLSNNVYSKITDLSSNLNSKINTKQNTLTFSSPLSNTSNNISIDLSTYLLSSTASSTYATISNLNTKQNTLTFSSPLTNTSNTISIDLSAYPLKTYVDGSFNTINTNKQNKFTVSTPLIKNDVSNNITIDLSAYPLKTYVDGSLNSINSTLGTKENALTFTTPLTRTTNTIGIDLSAYPLKTYVDGSFNTINTNKQNKFTVSTPLIKNDVTNNITIDLSAYDTISLRNSALGSYLLSSTASSTYATITNVNSKENALTFSAPLTRSVNTISIDLSNYLTSSTASSTYATITNVNSKENALTFSAPLTRSVNTISIDLSSYLTSSTASSTYATITNVNSKQNTLTFSNPFLNTSNSITLKYNSAQFNIDSNGNLNLANTTVLNGILNIHGGNPFAVLNNKMQVGSLTIGDMSLNYGGSSDWTCNTAGLMLECLNNTEIAVHDAANRVASLMYFEGGGANKITIGRNWAPWGAISNIILNGNVGIGTNTPNSLLHVKGNNPALTIMGQGASGATATLNLFTFDNGTNAGSCSLIATDTGSYGNTFKINLKTAFGAITTGQFTAFSIDNVGNVNIPVSLSIDNKLINNYLFNSTGGNYEAINNFNSIDKFGYTFINGRGSAPAYGPETDTQYYSWYIGLGADYPAISGLGSYGMQFAIGRYQETPKLCIRKNENGGWGTWSGITAEKAISLTSGDKTISGILTTTGNIDCGGGIAINGSNAFYLDTSVDAGNKTNTYINFKMAGATNDWCYLRQIGGAENFKLTFDFLDDVDARFCIRSISSYSTPNDTVIECFNVDNGNVTCTGYLTCGNNVWNRSADGVYRTYYATNEISYYCCGGNSTIGHIFYNNSYSNVFQIKNNGDISCNGALNVTGATTLGNSLNVTGATTLGNSLNVTGATTLGNSLTLTGPIINQYWRLSNDSDGRCRLQNNARTSYFNLAAKVLWSETSLQVNTTASITGNLDCGSLSVASRDINYYLFNNNNVNHENSYTNFNDVSVYGFRFIYAPAYNSPNGSYNNWYSWYIGLGANYNNNYGCQFAVPRNTNNPYLYVRYKENSSWGNWNSIRVVYADVALALASGNQTISGNLTTTGQITCALSTTTSYSPHDYVGVPYETTSGSSSSYTLRLILNSFTGFHRNFTNDEFFDENEPQLFKDTYEGRIVIATGKVATQIGNESDGFDIKYDKEGIFIEDTHPLIELSRTKKDKRVFGVLGRKDRKNTNEKRLIVNSIGEGAIWVCSSNGNIENGDYITSSDYLGYGEKQDDDLLHNYTVAKATMDCDFELDSPLYNCIEIEDLDKNGNKLRVAFIACTYHSG